MLNELLEEKKRKLQEKIGKRDEFLNRMLGLQDEISKLNERIKEQEQKVNQIQARLDEKKNSPLKYYIKSIFKKDYRKTAKALKGNLLEDENGTYHSLIEEKTRKEEEFERYKATISSIEESENELKLMENSEYGIKKMIKEDSTLLESPEFMIELIRIRPDLICIDKTDSEKVYTEFLNELLKVVDLEIERLKESEEANNSSPVLNWYEGFRNNMLSGIQELTEPGEAPKNKYKIPHKFLYEAIRKDVLQRKANGKRLAEQPFTLKGLSESVSLTLSTYFKLDGTIPLSTGKKIEELYTDENSDLYMHCTFSENPLISNNIFKNGLYLRNEYNHDLARTTVSQTQKEGTFFTFLDGTNQDKILISIPKDAYKILGNNTDSKDNHYILPQYVVGKIIENKTGEIEFMENPIPMNERNVYENTYIATKTSDMDDFLER